MLQRVAIELPNYATNRYLHSKENKGETPPLIDALNSTLNTVAKAKTGNLKLEVIATSSAPFLCTFLSPLADFGFSLDNVLLREKTQQQRGAGFYSI
jgi:hypothetical protein